MVKVRNGVHQPSDLRPYAHGRLDTRGNAAQIKGATYDYARNRLYVSLEQGDRIETFARPPLILVYSLNNNNRSPSMMPMIELLLDQ